MELDSTVITLPHLPAPSALNDPVHGHAARVARTAAPRSADREPVAAYGGGRLRRDPLRSELGAPVDRPTEEPRAQTRYYGDSPDALGRAATNLFFVQMFAQEEDPSNRPAVAHEQATAAYPSLGFDDEILLPGDAVPLGWFGNPRLDILV